MKFGMKVAVAGLGWWGKQIISCLSKSPRFDVIYGIDPNPPADVEEFRKLHKFTLDTSLDEALADPAVEGVVLATPHALHEEQALRVIAAGKSLFCEKPLNEPSCVPQRGPAWVKTGSNAYTGEPVAGVSAMWCVSLPRCS